MTSENRVLGPQDPDEDIHEVFEWGHPNPGRVGCPPREVLIALARRERSSKDAAYDHVANCSPCYREFLAEVEGQKLVSRSDRGRLFLRFRWAAAAALILAAIVGTWWFLRISREVTPGEELRAQLIDVRLNLRPYAVRRGVEDEGQLEPLSLTRGYLRLTMLLPIGLRPGGYEVQVVDADRQARAQGIGRAELRDEGTTLTVIIDLRSLERGLYQLAIRQCGGEWHRFPARVE